MLLVHNIASKVNISGNNGDLLNLKVALEASHHGLLVEVQKTIDVGLDN